MRHHANTKTCRNTFKIIIFCSCKVLLKPVFQNLFPFNMITTIFLKVGKPTKFNWCICDKSKEKKNLRDYISAIARLQSELSFATFCFAVAGITSPQTVPTRAHLHTAVSWFRNHFLATAPQWDEQSSKLVNHTFSGICSIRLSWNTAICNLARYAGCSALVLCCLLTSDLNSLGL